MLVDWGRKELFFSHFSLLIPVSRSLRRQCRPRERPHRLADYDPVPPTVQPLQLLHRESRGLLNTTSRHQHGQLQHRRRSREGDGHTWPCRQNQPRRKSGDSSYPFPHHLPGACCKKFCDRKWKCIFLIGQEVPPCFSSDSSIWWLISMTMQEYTSCWVTVLNRIVQRIHYNCNVQLLLGFTYIDANPSVSCAGWFCKNMSSIFISLARC